VRALIRDISRRWPDVRAGEDGYDGRSIQPYYAGLIAREHGGRVEARAEEERIEYVALLEPQAKAHAA